MEPSAAAQKLADAVNGAPPTFGRFPGSRDATPGPPKPPGSAVATVGDDLLTVSISWPDGSTTTFHAT